MASVNAVKASNFGLVLARARALASAGRWETCARECADVLHRFEGMPNPGGACLSDAARLYILWALADETSGNLVAARRALRRAVRLSPGRSEAWNAMGRVCHKLYRATGEWEFADESAAAGRNMQFIESGPQPGPSTARAAGVGQLTV